MFRRRREDGFDWDSANALIDFLMGMDAKLDHILDLLEEGHAEEDDG